MNDHSTNPEFTTGAIATRANIEAICSHRDASLTKIKEAAQGLDEAYTLAQHADNLAKLAHSGRSFYQADRSSSDAYMNLSRNGFDAEKSISTYRKKLDSDIWVYLFEVTGMRDMMDVEEVNKFEKSLLTEVPEISVENVSATFERLCGDADTIFKRGLANAFSKLDRRFKSHDVFKLGSRIILTNVFSDFGGWNYGSSYRETIADVERVFAVLDGEAPDMHGLIKAVDDSREGGWYPHQSICESRYFKIKGFKNGNAHLWFTRDDLVSKANKLLAEYYGDVLPDACEVDEQAENLKSRAGVPAKDLQFYATPDAAARLLLDDLFFSPEMRVLEPSAGTGNLVRPLLANGLTVDAIEIHPDRANSLEQIKSENLNVLNANFLRIPSEPIYDRVIMNPPFYGTHWIEHITHAFDFLKSGGTLRAILPVSAQVGETKKLQAFRRWVEKNNSSYRYSQFTPLPAESFAESGTKINTVILEIKKR